MQLASLFTFNFFLSHTTIPSYHGPVTSLHLATCTEAPMQGGGPDKSNLDPQQKSGTCAKGGQAEASTLLHESSNSEPETI